MNIRSSNFVVFRPRSAAAFRLFCFPHAGGAPATFFPWLAQFSDGIEVVCLQYPGRAHRLREQSATSVSQLVAGIAHEIDDFSEKPFAFYGHSLGGIVAFELARELRRLGRTGPHHLFIGAARPPQVASSRPPIHMLPDEEFIATVNSRYGGIPAAIAADSGAMEMFLPGLRGDFTAYETYQFSPSDPLSIPITVFGGEQDTAVSPDCLQGWEIHTDAAFDITLLAGGHFFPPASTQALIRVLERQIPWYQGESNPALAG
ncbi:MAG: alpha/beta fold hydrolase [Acidobacteriota bacterium]